MPKLQFSDRDLSSGSYLGLGRSRVRISKITPTQSQAGKPMLEVELKGIGENQGREGREFLPLSDEARWKIAQMAKACGFPPEHLKSGRFDTSEMVGKTFVLEKKEKGTRVVDGQEKKTYQSNYYPDAEDADSELGSVGEHDGNFDQATGDDLPF